MVFSGGLQYELDSACPPVTSVQKSCRGTEMVHLCQWHLLVTGHRLVWRVVRVESSLVEVVSVSIERVDMASIQGSFTVHHREQHSQEKELCSKLAQPGPHYFFFLSLLKRLINSRVSEMQVMKEGFFKKRSSFRFLCSLSHVRSWRFLQWALEETWSPNICGVISILFSSLSVFTLTPNSDCIRQSREKAREAEEGERMRARKTTQRCAGGGEMRKRRAGQTRERGKTVSVSKVSAPYTHVQARKRPSRRGSTLQAISTLHEWGCVCECVCKKQRAALLPLKGQADRKAVFAYPTPTSACGLCMRRGLAGNIISRFPFPLSMHVKMLYQIILKHCGYAFCFYAPPPPSYVFPSFINPLNIVCLFFFSLFLEQLYIKAMPQCVIPCASLQSWTQ